MKTLYSSFFVIAIMGVSFSALAQKWTVGLGYNYIYSPQWDEAIQTYNTSRPFLAEAKQPLLVSGSLIQISYFFKTQKSIGSGIRLEHSFLRSRAENQGLDVTLNLHLLDLGYVLRYGSNEVNKFGHELDISVVTHMLSRKVNEELQPIRDDRNWAYGIGPRIGYTSTYMFKLKQIYTIVPFVGLAYSPYFYSPNSEIALNQTRGLVGDNRMSLLSWKLGLRFNLSRNHAETKGGE